MGWSREDEFSEAARTAPPSSVATGHPRWKGGQGILRWGQCRNGPPQNAAAKQQKEGVPTQPSGKTPWPSSKIPQPTG